MWINSGIAQSLSREISTTVVTAFFHKWASAVGHAEPHPNRIFHDRWEFRLACEKKSGKLLVVTHGLAIQIAEDFRNIKGLVGYFAVNVSDIIRGLCARAHAVGIDLSRPFFFRPTASMRSPPDQRLWAPRWADA